MREETFFEHCLRRFEAGDTYTELVGLVRRANKAFKMTRLSESEVKTVRKIDYSLRVRKGWETRRKKQESAELEAKSKVYPQ